MAEEDDIRVEIRFKNSRLFNAIREWSVPLHEGARMQKLHERGPVKSFCKVYSLNLEQVYELLNLRRGPLTRTNHGVVKLRPICLRLAEIFDVGVGWLFPADLYKIEWPTLAIETSVLLVVPLLSMPTEQRLLPPTQEVSMNSVELRELIRLKLDTLTPREAKIVRMRFGLDSSGEHTMEEVGKDFGVGRERIRQIEAKALRKLRHPSRSRELREFVDGYVELSRFSGLVKVYYDHTEEFTVCEDWCEEVEAFNVQQAISNIGAKAQEKVAHLGNVHIVVVHCHKMYTAIDK